MNSYIQKIISDLNGQIENLGLEINKLSNRLFSLKNERGDRVLKCLDFLIPNLEKETIRDIYNSFPDFAMPVTTKWFGLKLVLDEGVTLNSLQSDLCSYLNHNPAASPEIWQEQILPIDNEFIKVQDKIAEIAKIQLDLKKKLSAYEKFQTADFQKLDPEVKGKIETSLRVVSEMGACTNTKIPKKKVEYPEASRGSVEFGLVEAYLLYQLLSPDSELSTQVSDSFTPGGGNSDGGGAQSGWEYSEPQAPDSQSESFHSELGSGQFS